MCFSLGEMRSTINPNRLASRVVGSMRGPDNAHNFAPCCSLKVVRQPLLLTSVALTRGFDLAGGWDNGALPPCRGGSLVRNR